jgi:hypothetical protein
LYRVPETPGKGKTNPVMGQAVLQNEELRAPATKAPAGLENLPNLTPFF